MDFKVGDLIKAGNPPIYYVVARERSAMAGGGFYLDREGGGTTILKAYNARHFTLVCHNEDAAKEIARLYAELRAVRDKVAEAINGIFKNKG